MEMLVNNVDYEAVFADLDAAKKYYSPDLDEFPECKEYAEEIQGAEDLEELAQVLNRYTDIFSDGRYHEVKEV